MKTTLPDHIETVEQAKTFLTDLYNNGEAIHPEDPAHSIVWIHLPIEQIPTPEECAKLDKLMDDIYNLDGNAGNHANPKFDPCEWLWATDHSTERV